MNIKNESLIYVFVVFILLFILLLIKSYNTPAKSEQVVKISIEYEYGYHTIYENITGTVYHPDPKQTDNTPFITATGDNFKDKNINKIRWCALSRDLLDRSFKDRKGTLHRWNGKIKLHDTIYVESKHTQLNGYWVVKDVMGKYHINKSGDTIQQVKRIDFLQDHNDTTSFLLHCKDIKIRKRYIKGGILKFQ